VFEADEFQRRERMMKSKPFCGNESASFSAVLGSSHLKLPLMIC
jgi:hypothetical protein